ncbi:ribosomal prt L37A [Enterospora canceri]|uniref:Ribosomal prt L37A n=1 Tax=Enterospora canceri TaxID=1081671 RepID=A0A1Y1S5C5_9MICR|nr:ribosomal prt L37A [Enterospora canceri]
MSRGTKKAGITGKYGCRYGSTLRKTIKGIEESQHRKYTCKSCGKDSVKREVVGIWECRSCGYKFAGAAYAPTSPSGRTYSALIRSMNKQK